MGDSERQQLNERFNHAVDKLLKKLQKYCHEVIDDLNELLVSVGKPVQPKSPARSQTSSAEKATDENAYLFASFKALTTSDKQITDEKSKLFSQLKREWDAEISALREVDTLQMFAHLNRVETEIDSWGETEKAHQKRCTIREARRLLQVMNHIGDNEFTES